MTDGLYGGKHLDKADWRFWKDEVIIDEDGYWWHVRHCYRDVATGERLYRLEDATWTAAKYYHPEDIEDRFEPAGWTTTTKPAHECGYRVNGVLCEPANAERWLGTSCVSDHDCEHCGATTEDDADFIVDLDGRERVAVWIECDACGETTEIFGTPDQDLLDGPELITDGGTGTPRETATTDITVDIPDGLLASMDAAIEQSAAYDSRDDLVRVALRGETAGVTPDTNAREPTTRTLVLDLLEEGEKSRQELLSKVVKPGHSVTDLDEALDLLVREGEIYECGEDQYRLTALVADGGTEPDGAVDHGFAEAEQSAREHLEAELDGIRQTILDGDVCIDLVTRQVLVVRERVADDLAEYYEREGFDLASYKTHPYLPVTLDDPVFECLFVGGIEKLHKPGRTYDYPRGRLARVPVEQAGDDS